MSCGLIVCVCVCVLARHRFVLGVVCVWGGGVSVSVCVGQDVAYLTDSAFQKISHTRGHNDSDTHTNYETVGLIYLLIT